MIILFDIIKTMAKEVITQEVIILRGTHEKFCQLYVETLDPVEAIMGSFNIGARGGSKIEKDARKVALTMGRELLNKLEIRQRISVLLQDVAIDSDSRVGKLAQMFWHTKDVKEAVVLSQEISKIQGDYAPAKSITASYKRELKDVTVDA